MGVFRTIRSYICYCGIEKEEYKALKKDAYVSNFRVWQGLHVLMAVVFGALFVASGFSHLMGSNRVFYLCAFAYSLAAIAAFCFLKKGSLAAQLIIYLSISLLFLFSGFITANKPDIPATAFITLLLITPMFMIDKPYFMAIELTIASAVFLTWMHGVKPAEVWRIDVVNVAIFLGIGIVLHIIANSIRIKEFVLTRKINIQKDTDEMTGLMNKSALTRAIDGFLADGPADGGVMFLLDVDRFKLINDTYGHDTGDQVIRQLGAYLAGRFTGGEITGRFGGDEFIVFIRDMDDPQAACRTAEEIIRGVSEQVSLPEGQHQVSVSVGIVVRSGGEKNYSEIFRKADAAMYRAKADPEKRFCIYEPAE
ncbi:MAG: GGDEF domain-containing protein [Clostridiales bacterium]|nr:GGDEF domain-containing protein [Clostridiales bacterium]